VLYIAGAARSGSTLLERLIGMQDGFCSVGELQFIWQRAFVEDQLCGCGTPFLRCTFWRDVSRHAFGVDPSRFDGALAWRLKTSLDRKHQLLAPVLGHRPARSSAAHFEYGGLLSRLYRAISDVAGARMLVDSSKDPRHGLLLAQLPGFEVHVVHLVRDPRAVAFSWTRRRRRPEIHWRDQNMEIERVSTSARRWATYNLCAELLSGAAASYTCVRYEDFVEQPQLVLSEILSPHSCCSRAALQPAATSAMLEPAHTVSGNPMRFIHGRVQIALDDEWRSAMLPRQRRLVTTLTSPLLGRYGYSLRCGS
jgi:hypothetical protein